MEAKLPKKVTVPLGAKVHQRSAQPHVISQDRFVGYVTMATDKAREADAADWTEALLCDVVAQPKRSH